MRDKKSILKVLFGISYIGLIGSVFTYIICTGGNVATIASYAFAVCAVILTASRSFLLPSANDFRVKRLNGMLAIGALLLIATAYLLIINNNIWAITLTIAAFIDIFTSYRYPQED
ncbi:MAG: hypothetical protein R3Y59_08395 [bacterium]